MCEIGQRGKLLVKTENAMMEEDKDRNYITI